MGIADGPKLRRWEPIQGEIALRHDEAEAYARETNVPGRRAAVDMNSFEHDRASWRSRHQRVAAPSLMKVVNGRMPE
jgi:hypothetical protein